MFASAASEGSQHGADLLCMHCDSMSIFDSSCAGALPRRRSGPAQAYGMATARADPLPWLGWGERDMTPEILYQRSLLDMLLACSRGADRRVSSCRAYSADTTPLQARSHQPPTMHAKPPQCRDTPQCRLAVTAPAVSTACCTCNNVVARHQVATDATGQTSAPYKALTAAGRHAPCAALSMGLQVC